MLYVKPVPDVDILFTIVTVYLSVFFSHSCCLPVSGEIKLYIKPRPVLYIDSNSLKLQHGNFEKCLQHEKVPSTLCRWVPLQRALLGNNIKIRVLLS